MSQDGLEFVPGTVNEGLRDLVCVDCGLDWRPRYIPARPDGEIRCADCQLDIDCPDEAEERRRRREEESVSYG